MTGITLKEFAERVLNPAVAGLREAVRTEFSIEEWAAVERAVVSQPAVKLTEAECYMIEAAMQDGFEPHSDNDTGVNYLCTDEQVVAFAKRMLAAGEAKVTAALPEYAKDEECQGKCGECDGGSDAGNPHRHGSEAAADVLGSLSQEGIAKLTDLLKETNAALATEEAEEDTRPA